MFSFRRNTTIPNSAHAEQNKKAIAISPVAKITAFAVLIALAISAGVSYYVYQSEIVQEKNAQLDELTRQRAELTADNVRLWVTGLQTELEAFVEKPSVLSAITQDNNSTLPELIAMLKKSIDGINAIRMFRPGEADLDSEGNPPIRYAELDMIRGAERGEHIPPELTNIDNKWLLTFVLAVPSAESQNTSEDDAPLPPAGIAVLSFEASQLLETLKRNNEGKVKVVLQQKVNDGNAIDTLEAGAGGESSTAEEAIPDTWWAVKVEAAPLLRANTHVNQALILGILAVGTLLLVCIAILVGRLLGNKITSSGKSGSVTAGLAEMVVGGKKEGAMIDPLYQKKGILDIAIKEQDEKLLGLEDAQPKKSGASAADKVPAMSEKEASAVPDEIFRAYDIRGIAKTQITKELANKIGQAIGSEALDNNEHTIVVARDARIHSPELTEYLIRGILSSGCNIINIGTVPTPIMYFATETLEETRSGVMVTASHNPAEYNGFKIVINGICRAEEDIKAIRARILSRNMHEGKGTESRLDIVPDYIDTIFSDVALAGDVSIVLDAANGVTGLVAPRLFEELGCMVTPLFCDIDGNFPNHSPDPSIPQNLQPLIEKVKEVKADLGVAFDGDGDRLVVVTPKGEIIWPDRLLMLYAKDIVSRNPGADVVFDVKSTRHLVQTVTSYGGRPIMWKTGHSHMKSKVNETGALIGGEYSGHIFIKDRWYGFDDGMYAAARLIEVMTLQGQDLDEIMKEFPQSPSTPEIRVQVAEENKFNIIKTLVEEGDFGDARITTLDGIRADYQFGWGLVRASNTSSCLTMRFEADDEESLHQLKSIFVKELRKVDHTIQVEWD